MSSQPFSTDAEQSTDQHDMVTFRLDQQIYALPITSISKIIDMVAITPIPQVNHAIEGIINVHGDTVPIINLRRHLNLPEAPFKLHTHIILAQNNGRTFGLIVDQVMDVLSLPAGQIAAPDQILPKGLGKAPLLQGLVHTSEGTVLLLNLEQMFKPQQAQALAHAMEAMAEETTAQ